MTVALQIRNVPDDVRDAIADKASAQGRSMQAILLEMVEREARGGRNAQLLSAGTALRVDLDVNEVVATIRQGRDDGFAVDRDEL